VTPNIVLTDTPNQQMRRAIVEPLLRFNAQGAGRPVDYRPLALLLIHPETGGILAACAAARTSRNCMWTCCSCPTPCAVAVWAGA
jgi:hypothetical protein